MQEFIMKKNCQSKKVCQLIVLFFIMFQLHKSTSHADICHIYDIYRGMHSLCTSPGIQCHRKESEDIDGKI